MDYEFDPPTPGERAADEDATKIYNKGWNDAINGVVTAILDMDPTPQQVGVSTMSKPALLAVLVYVANKMRYLKR
jgi:hypothetical protein